MPPGASPRNGVALVIGVGQYPHPEITRLQFATNDAEAVAEVLADPQVCAFPAEQIALLIDEAAQRDAIIDRLSRWLPERGRGAEIVVLYFAGHGIVQKVGKQEEGFLFPFDADPANPAGRGIAMRDITRWVEGIEASAVVVCLDCCHAGKVLHRGPSDSIARNMAIRPAILQNLSGKGRFLLASCDEGQFSVELADLKHGLFTFHLLEGLKGAGDRDGDGKVGVAELFEYVSEGVARDARKVNVEQHPWNSSVGAGGVYLAAPTRRESAQIPSLERLAREHGSANAIRELERQLPQADVPRLLEVLRLLGKWADPAGLSCIFHNLHHASEAVRDQAKRALQALGRDQALAAVKEQARQADAPKLRILIDGLQYFDARADLIQLLDYLVDRLEGDALVQAHQLREKKQLSLGLEKARELFVQNHSPYNLEKVLGQGLFTAAYLARHVDAGLEVVVRVLRPEFVSQPEVRKQFLELSRRSMRFVHQNLVTTRDIGNLPEQDIYYTVRDYVQGVTLREALHGGKRFEPDQVVLILRQVAQALTPVHRDRQWHGGVKPSNIFIGSDDVVILGDPSLPVHGVGEALKKRLSYDYRYAAPETFVGSQAPGPAADFYALGCVAYELFCGQPPFVADHYNELLIHHVREPVPRPSEQTPGLAVGVERLLLRLLEKDSKKRLGNIQEALDIFGHVFDTPPAPSPLVARAPLLRDASLAQYQPPDSLASLSQAVPWATVNSTMQAQGSMPPISGATHSPRPDIPGYEILTELGRGGMGTVWKARHISLDRVVALKLIGDAALAGPDALARFRREAEAVARLQHPNIVQIFDFGQFEGWAFLSMQFVEGGTLQQKLRDNPMPAKQAAKYAEILASAVHYAHQRGIIHRDLKPGNILLTADGTPKITDFGLAKRLEDKSDPYVTHSGVIMGTPAYMAPEQARGESKAVGPAADVYGLGAILYEMLSGQPPFKGATAYEMIRMVFECEPVPPRQLNAEVSRDLETICLKCLEKDPTRRYSSAGALADDLRRFIESEPIMARQSNLLERTYKHAKGRPMVVAALWLTGLMTVVLTLALLKLLGYLW